MKMAINAEVPSFKFQVSSLDRNALLDNYEFQKFADQIWKRIQGCDEFVQKNEPFKVIKTDREKAVKDIEHLLSELHEIALSLQPLLPKTSEKILAVLKDPKLENIPRLFPRIE
jgi:methionyl-tRNA synthetase